MRMLRLQSIPKNNTLKNEVREEENNQAVMHQDLDEETRAAEYSIIRHEREEE